MIQYLPNAKSCISRSSIRCLCRLIFAGKQMNDDKMAKEYNIEGGSVLHLVRHNRFLRGVSVYFSSLDGTSS